MQRGVTADLHTSNVSSIAQLQHNHGPFTGTVVAAGAAAGVLPEIGMPNRICYWPCIIVGCTPAAEVDWSAFAPKPLLENTFSVILRVFGVE